MNEIQTKKVLAGLAKAKREKLRRVVLVSTADDYAIAQQVDCNPFHVQAMRDRLITLGVGERPFVEQDSPIALARAAIAKAEGR